MALNIETHLDSEDAYPELVSLERESRRIYRMAQAVRDSIKNYVDTGDAQIKAANMAAAAAAALPAGQAKVDAQAAAAAALTAGNELRSAVVSVRAAWNKRFVP